MSDRFLPYRSFPANILSLLVPLCPAPLPLRCARKNNSRYAISAVQAERSCALRQEYPLPSIPA